MTSPTAPRTRLYIAGASQLTLNLVQSTQEANIVLGAISLTGERQFATQMAAWRDAAWAAFRTLMTTDVTCTGATVRYVDTASGAVTELQAPASPAGAVAGGPTLAAGSTLIKWGTAVGGRSGKGRTYLPGLPLSAVQAGGRQYAAGHQTAVAAAVSSYLGASVFASDLKPCVLSFTTGEGNVITSGALAPIVGLQRKRMR